MLKVMHRLLAKRRAVWLSQKGKEDYRKSSDYNGGLDHGRMGPE
jgi:hypothetical protein